MTQIDNRVTIIGICGKARSGKDTAAQAILDHIMDYSDKVEFEAGYVVGIESYAAPIKSMIAMLLDFFDKGAIMQPETLQPYIDGDKKEEIIPEIGMSTRVLMQTLGTEWGRNIVNPDIWLNSMRARLAKYPELVDHGYKGAFVLIPDVRFENEAKALKDLGATILYVDRAVDEVGDGDHSSESGIPGSLIDFKVFNDNIEISEFKPTVVSILASLLPFADSYEEALDHIIKENEEDDSVDEELPDART